MTIHDTFNVDLPFKQDIPCIEQVLMIVGYVCVQKEIHFCHSIVTYNVGRLRIPTSAG